MAGKICRRARRLIWHLVRAWTQRFAQNHLQRASSSSQAPSARAIALSASFPARPAHGSASVTSAFQPPAPHLHLALTKAPKERACLHPRQSRLPEAGAARPSAPAAAAERQPAGVRRHVASFPVSGPGEHVPGRSHDGIRTGNRNPFHAIIGL